MSKQTFGEFLNQRLNATERVKMAIWTVITIVLSVLAFQLKPEFGAIFVVIVVMGLGLTFVSVHATWRKTQR